MIKMQGYKIWCDPRAEVTRKQLRQLEKRDMAESMRWALHLSQEELNFLEMANPEFNLDMFVASNDSKPFRIEAQR